jgi:hypothetical protein
MRFLLSAGTGPEVPDAALKTAFNLLMAALVLALLMENAFALLFNWRLFQEFLVGRAWRTVIMFTVSLLVVDRFDLDLMASLFDAFHGAGGTRTHGNWLTTTLTAMIIAGGSAGVNRILVGLGFRSQLTKVEEERRELGKRNFAYLSVTVQSDNAGARFRVNALSTACDGLPEVLGVIGRARRARLQGLLFANPGRFPRSGGHRLDAALCYRISVVDVDSGRVFDTTGAQIGSPELGTALRFAAGAVIDLDIVLDGAGLPART